VSGQKKAESGLRCVISILLDALGKKKKKATRLFRIFSRRNQTSARPQKENKGGLRRSAVQSRILIKTGGLSQEMIVYEGEDWDGLGDLGTSGVLVKSEK